MSEMRLAKTLHDARQDEPVRPASGAKSEHARFWPFAEVMMLMLMALMMMLR